MLATLFRSWRNTGNWVPSLRSKNTRRRMAFSHDVTLLARVALWLEPFGCYRTWAARFYSGSSGGEINRSGVCQNRPFPRRYGTMIDEMDILASRS